MKLLVCISNVPDTTAKITFTNDNTQFDTSGVQFVPNPYDEIALAKALELSEGGKGSVTVITVGEADAEPTLRKALAAGADHAVRINGFPSNALYTAQQIAGYAKDKGFDIILTGQESIDYNGSVVPAMLAQFLDLPLISAVKKLDAEGQKASMERQTEEGKEIIEVELPFIVSCTEGLAEPRIPNMRGIMSARTKPLDVTEAETTESLTKYLKYETPSPKTAAKILSADETGKLVELLHEEAKVI